MQAPYPERGKDVEFFFVLLIAVLFVRLIKAYLVSSKETPPLVLSDTGGEFRSGAGRYAFQWLEAGRSFVCRGYSVPDGMVYVGERMRDFSGKNDSCLINPLLPVTEGIVSSEHVGDVRPHYEKMTPQQRGGYLNWLGGGRTEPLTDPAWLFLFFYGLERRLFLDGPRGYVQEEDRRSITTEVRRLMTVYGEHRSFLGYCRNLLATNWVLQGDYSEIPEWLDFTDRFCAGTFDAMLALHVSRNEPIPGEIAHQWVVLHPESGPGTAARRFPETFKKLFLQSYQKRFGDGIRINPNRSPLNLVYNAANPSLGMGMKLRAPSLPDPFLLATPFKRIRAVAEECVSEMLTGGDALPPALSGFGASPARLEILDDVHRELLARLSGKSIWPRQELLSVCESLSLSPDASLEVLNEWACSTEALSVVEDGNPVFVDTSLLHDMILGQTAGSAYL
jgi:hypothetical protein